MANPSLAKPTPELARHRSKHKCAGKLKKLRTIILVWQKHSGLIIFKTKRQEHVHANECHNMAKNMNRIEIIRFMFLVFI